MTKPLAYDCEVRVVPAVQVRPLRKEVLRPNQTAADCVFPGDDEPGTIHFAAMVEGRIAGIASLYIESPEGKSCERAWRLRGMATEEAVRGAGLGRKLVEACMAHARRHGAQLMWCNARVPAAGFYEGLGFEKEGPVFELPVIGPHVFMKRHLAE